MKPAKVGQVVKFHTPYPDEDPKQLYVVLEIKGNDDTTRVDIKTLNTGQSFPSIHTVLLKDLEIVAVDTNDLIGHTVKIKKADDIQAIGKVLKVREEKIIPDFIKGVKGIETNVWLTIIDDEENEQTGTLFIN